MIYGIYWYLMTKKIILVEKKWKMLFKNVHYTQTDDQTQLSDAIFIFLAQLSQNWKHFIVGCQRLWRICLWCLQMKLNEMIRWSYLRRLEVKLTLHSDVPWCLTRIYLPKAAFNSFGTQPPYLVPVWNFVSSVSKFWPGFLPAHTLLVTIEQSIWILGCKDRKSVV